MHFISTTCLLALTTSAFAATLPIVDLGYIRQQATAINTTGGYYNFSNIRYAEPPTGSLRFALPVAPSGINSSIDDGSVPRICPQAGPDWSTVEEAFLVDYLTGNEAKFDFNSANATAFSMPVTPQAADATEDCLFLDVIVPETIFDGNTSAPVLVWIYGGGMTEGSKVSSGSPAGLIKASQATGADGVIFVAMNYRLGALGWLGGPTIEASGVANAALYDQRLALEWVQHNIHLFGGNPSEVTVMGESAGAASIMHQITAFGNSSTAPFQRAILQSPAFQPQTDRVLMEKVTQNFLGALGVNSVAEAREQDSAAVIQANSQVVQDSVYGSFTFGVVVDNLIVPALPGQLLYEGRFSKDITIMVGHNEDEGILFTDPEVQTAIAYTQSLQTVFPSMSLSVLAYLENVLYPSIFTDEAAYGYDSEFTREVATLAEFAITCNTVYLENAFSNNTYSYQFDVFPALHGEDIGYTFWDGGNTDTYSLPLNQSIAQGFQEYLTSFALTGVPAASGYPTFPLYTSAQNILNLEANSFVVVKDDVNRTRCAFWQQALYNGQEVSVDGLGISEGVASAVIMTASAGASTYTGSVSGAVSPSAPVGGGGIIATTSSATVTSVSGATETRASTSGMTTGTAATSNISGGASATGTAAAAGSTNTDASTGPAGSVAVTSASATETVTTTSSSAPGAVSSYTGAASSTRASLAGVLLAAAALFCIS